MREMIVRERQERVAHLTAIGQMVARVFNVDADKAFGGVIAEYASEVFQETYDPDMLVQRVAALREAQARIRAKRRSEQSIMDRLERMTDAPSPVVEHKPAPKKPSKNK